MGHEAAGGSCGDSFPPAGWVLRGGACRVCGVSIHTFERWVKRGHVGFGESVRKPGGGRCKIYPVVEVARLGERMAAERGRLPEGYVGIAEAAAMFGISVSNWMKWQSAGHVPQGVWLQLPDVATRVRGYARADVRRWLEAYRSLGQPYVDETLPGAGVARVPVMRLRATRCEALIDAADLPRVAGKRWNWVERSQRVTPGVVESSRMHAKLQHVVLGLDAARWRIEHANGDPLDCRRANLVVRDMSEKRQAARKIRVCRGRPCTSRFKGVIWDQTRGKWRASIKRDDKGHFLGRFDDERAAAEAYDEAARELFGEHARLNFPDPGGVGAWLASEMAEQVAEAREEGPADEPFLEHEPEAPSAFPQAA